MKARFVLCLCLTLLCAGLAAVPAAAGTPTQLVRFSEDEYPGYATAFGLDGANGYAIGFSAYAGESGRGRLRITARRKGGVAFYDAPAMLTESILRADLGALGRVDLVLRPSGRQKTIHIKCSREEFTYEPGVYEGVVEFEGEEGYTRAHATRVAKAPTVSSFCGGSGSGEAFGPDLPGARLRGLSFAHGRTLSFQFNKNRPASPTLFTASLKERDGAVVINRAAGGRAPASSFRFDKPLQGVTLDPPAPFSGSASLRHSPDAVSPLLAGNLAIDFPGRSDVALTGPAVHVSIVHARYSRSGHSGYVEIGF